MSDLPVGVHDNYLAKQIGEDVLGLVTNLAKAIELLDKAVGKTAARVTDDLGIVAAQDHLTRAEQHAMSIDTACFGGGIIAIEEKEDHYV